MKQKYILDFNYIRNLSLEDKLLIIRTISIYKRLSKYNWLYTLLTEPPLPAFSVNDEYYSKLFQKSRVLKSWLINRKNNWAAYRSKWSAPIIKSERDYDMLALLIKEVTV